MNSFKFAVLGAGVLAFSSSLFATRQDAQSAADAVREGVAQKPRTPAFIEAAVGPRFLVEDGSGGTLGSFHDHVLDKETGEVLFVVVQITLEGAQRNVLVPFQRFVWDDEERTFTLPLRPEQLEASQEFDPERLQKLTRVGATRGAGGDAERGSPGTTRGDDAEVVRNILASQALGASVQAGETAAGTVGALALEPRLGRIAAAFVQDPPGGEKPALVVPWQAMRRDQDGNWSVGLATEKLEEAPRARSSNVRALEDPEWLEGMYRFYGLRSPLHLAIEGATEKP